MSLIYSLLGCFQVVVTMKWAIREENIGKTGVIMVFSKFIVLGNHFKKTIALIKKAKIL